MSSSIGPSSEVPGLSRSSVLALSAMVLAVAMTTIDQTIVSLAAPTIQGELGLSHDGLQWAVSSYLLATAAFFCLGGRLADIFGYRRMVLIGILGFAGASLMCGLTPTGAAAEAWLVLARALQGVSGALMYPAALGIVRSSFPASGQGRAMAAFFGISGAMTAIGPIAGGYLTQWTWRAIFWINIPIAVLAVVLLVAAKTKDARRPGRIDWPGAGLVAAGMAMVVLGLQQAADWGWGNPATAGLIIVGVAVLVVFVRRQLRVSVPLVRLTPFKDRGFAVSAAAMFFASFAFVPVFFFLSVYAQVSQGQTGSSAGLILLKFFIGFLVGSRFGGKLFDQAGAKRVLLIGGAVGAAGFCWLASTLTDLPVSSNFFNSQFWPIAVAGAGIGYMFAATSTDMIDRSIDASYGETTGISQSLRNFGASTGLAVLTTTLTTHLLKGLTTSIVALGGTAADAQTALNVITGASDRPAAAVGNVPAAAREAVSAAVAHDYAAAAQWAFYGMAAAMAVVALLSLEHPAGRVVRDEVPTSAQ